MRILLVEDHAVTQELLRQMLALVPGAEVVHVATTSAAAVDWLSRHEDGWELAVIDLFLADGHGFDVLRACRKVRREQRAVVVSNYTRDPVRDHARQAGADAVFDKSFELDALVEYCAEFCRTLDARFRPPAPLALVHPVHPRHERRRTLR